MLTNRIAKNQNKVKMVDSPEVGAKYVARQIANLIEDKAKMGKNCVLGLATGNTPIMVYRELIRIHKEEGLSFANVITFNLDEYYPISKEDEQSYHHFMFFNLFNHVDIPKDHINIPKGDLSIDEVSEFCIDYERKIRLYGGIDIQLLGIGRSGHIGFNEPGSSLQSVTRMVDLNEITRTDASPQFNGIQNVPQKAITMGVKPILESKKIVLMAWGKSKSKILKEAMYGEISDKIPATYLQLHKNVEFVMDHDAAINID